MRSVAQIDADLAARREELLHVQGRETEVYSRIVGYYRSLRNWNYGKKSEFHERQTYDANASLANHVDGTNAKEFVSFQLFTRANCPGCRVAKQVLNGEPELAVRLDEVDIDSSEGLKLAEEEMVMVTPTLIARDEAGRELWRSTDPRQMQERLATSERASA